MIRFIHYSINISNEINGLREIVKSSLYGYERISKTDLGHRFHFVSILDTKFNNIVR